MAKPALAAGAILSTVTNTAQTLSNVVNTVNDGVSILNGYVSRHRIMQQDKNVVELHNSRVRLIEDTALDIAEQRQVIGAKLKDASFKAAYELAHSEIYTLFNPEEA